MTLKIACDRQASKTVTVTINDASRIHQDKHGGAHVIGTPHKEGIQAGGPGVVPKWFDVHPPRIPPASCTELFKTGLTSIRQGFHIRDQLKAACMVAATEGVPVRVRYMELDGQAGEGEHCAHITRCDCDFPTDRITASGRTIFLLN